MPVTNFPRTKLATAGEIASAVAAGDLIYVEPTLILPNDKVVTDLEVRDLVARRLNSGTISTFCTPWEDLYDDRFIEVPNIPLDLLNHELSSTATQTTDSAISLDITNLAVMDGRVHVGFEMANPITLANNQVKIFNIKTYYSKLDGTVSSTETKDLIDVGPGPRVVLIPSFPTIGTHGYETLHVSFGVAGIPQGQNITIRFVMRLVDLYNRKNFTSNWFNVGHNSDISYV